MDIKSKIREVPDFPKPGILFYDITTVLKEPDALKATIEQMYERIKDLKIDKIAGIESRGFIFAVPLALKLGVGFVPIRKPGKLPADVVRESYDLEYGSNTIELHMDAVSKGENILIVDDLLATGGTMKAAENIVKKLGGNVVAALFMVELNFLKGREKLETDSISLINYDS